jgi:pimeloyl-ACP methyl ester carboxylesterase
MPDDTPRSRGIHDTGPVPAADSGTLGTDEPPLEPAGGALAYPAASEPERRRRWPKVLAWTLIPLVLLLAVAAAGIGWYYSNEILTVTHSEDTYDIEVVEVRDGAVVLAGGGVEHPQITGLEWEGGYARLLAGAEITADGVLREFEPFPDTPEPGTNVRLDFYASPDDLSSTSDIGAEHVTFDAPLGALDATYVPGEQERWIIFVHGRGASQAETFRLLPVVAELGYPSMAISYRNDAGAPEDPDGWWRLGWTESADLDAAVDYALANGAEDVVLVGYSMGGAIVGNYLRTEGDDQVAGVIYDSAVLSWTDTLNFEAADRGLPSFLTTLASAAVRVRAGIDLSQLDQVEHADRLSVPVLLVHGTGDATVPVASSDEFAEARPDLVTYLRLDGAEHVQGWNSHRLLYEDAVATFLSDL